MTLEQAIDLVARRVIASVVEDQAEWEDYPEIGQDDWDRVLERVKEMTAGIDPEAVAYHDAYALLEKRASIFESDTDATPATQADGLSASEVKE